MCDTYVVMKGASSRGKNTLCKNSDRPEFDCQPLAMHLRKRCDVSEKLKLAYVSIDQVPERYATLGSSPYWCWGYEEGINEFGVAIGNEAIYSKDLPENAEAEQSGKGPEKGLLGMEVLRLGLERGKTAKEALDVMTSMVETYGQWGSGVPTQNTVEGSYNNSYIIADATEAWVLETVGKRWAARKIEQNYAAISNEISIRTDVTLHNEDLIDYAIERGWWSEENRYAFDFAKAYINEKSARQVSHIRCQRIRQLLKDGIKENGEVSIEYMKRILRDHYEGTFLEGPYFNAANPDFLTVCMHDSLAGFTWGNTASSSIMELGEGDELHTMWWAPVAPCCSVFIPVFMEAKALPELLTNAGTYGKVMCAPSDVAAKDTYKEGSFWWEIRSLLDEIKGDAIGTEYTKRHAMVRKYFDELEEKWMLEYNVVTAEALALRKVGKEDEMAELLYNFTDNCVNEAMLTITNLRNMFATQNMEKRARLFTICK